MFQYECQLTCDENVKFESKSDDLFLAGQVLYYDIYKVENYKAVMYVNNEFYIEIVPSSSEIIQFRYATGYRDVSIEFKLIENI